MKVAYIVSRFPTTTETFIAREMSALRRQGVDVCVFALVREESAIAQPEAEGFTARQVGPLSATALSAQFRWLRRRPARLVGTWWSAVVGNIRSPRFLARALVVVPEAAWFAERVVDEDIDWVHAHWATHSALAAWVVHRLTGRPYSITAHAHDIFVDHSMLERKFSDAAFVAVISDFNADYVTTHFPTATAGKVHVVRCGVIPESIRPASHTDQGQVRFVCVGSLKDYKGHRVLLDAFALLVDSGRNVQLDLIGDGELRTDLETQAARLGLGDRLRFLGALDSGQVADTLTSADVFVLASVITSSGKMEGIPVALMEAGLAGLPAVTSRLSGVPELVVDGETGLLVEPGDPQALADAMARLADSPQLREQLGTAARGRVLAEYTVDHNGRRLHDLFLSYGTSVREAS